MFKGSIISNPASSDKIQHAINGGSRALFIMIYKINESTVEKLILDLAALAFISTPSPLFVRIGSSNDLTKADLYDMAIRLHE